VRLVFFAAFEDDLTLLLSGTALACSAKNVVRARMVRQTNPNATAAILQVVDYKYFTCSYFGNLALFLLFRGAPVHAFRRRAAFLSPWASLL